MSFSQEEMQAVIDSGRLLVAEAQKLLAQKDNLFSQQGIDPQRSLAELNAPDASPAMQLASAQVAERVKQIEEELATQRMHTAKARPAGQRPRIPKNMV